MLLQQQQQQMHQQQQQMQQFGTVLALLQQQMADQRTSTPRQPSATIASSAMDSVLENTITTFSYAPDDDITFAAWYKRYEDIFNVDGKNLDDAARVRFLLRKLDAVAYEKSPASTSRHSVRRDNHNTQRYVRPTNIDIQPTLSVPQNNEERP